MKKYILTSIVLIAFILYSLATRKVLNTAVPVSVENMPIALPTSKPSPSLIPSNTLRDGTFTGSIEDAFYGNIQVAAVIESGRLVQVRILSYPNDRGRSIEINSRALPLLQQEAIRAQSAQVDIVSGATDSSQAYISSLTTALQLAKS